MAASRNYLELLECYAWLVQALQKLTLSSVIASQLLCCELCMFSSFYRLALESFADAKTSKVNTSLPQCIVSSFQLFMFYEEISQPENKVIRADRKWRGQNVRVSYSIHCFINDVGFRFHSNRRLFDNDFVIVDVYTFHIRPWQHLFIFLISN